MKRQKKPFWLLKKRIFKKPKDRIFFQTGRTHAFGQKMPFFSLLDLIKITLQIMLSDFAEKKETFFDLKKQHFLKSKRSHFFSNGPNPCFRPKNAIFFFIRFDQNNTSNNAFWLCREKRNLLDLKRENFSKSKKRTFSIEIMLSDFAEKKETFFTLKKRIFQSPNNPLF